MNKLTVAYFESIAKVLKLRHGTMLLIRGKVGSLINNAISKEDLTEWIFGLKAKHPTHPVIKDLKTIIALMKKNKLDLILW